MKYEAWHLTMDRKDTTMKTIIINASPTVKKTAKIAIKIALASMQKSPFCNIS